MLDRLSSAAFLNAKLAQLGDENRCTVIISSSAWAAGSPFGHQRNRKALQSSRTTLTWRNMASTSAMRATASCRKRVSNPTREFVRSGPCKSLSFKELPRCSAEQSKMMRLGWVENSMMGKVTSSSLNTERSLHIPSEGGLLCRLRTLHANLNPSTDASSTIWACVRQPGFYCSQDRVRRPSKARRLCSGRLAKQQYLALFLEPVCHSVTTKFFHHKQSRWTPCCSTFGTGHLVRRLLL